MSLAGKELGKDVVVWTEHQTRSSVYVVPSMPVNYINIDIASDRWCQISCHLGRGSPLNLLVPASRQAVVGVRRRHSID
jgi:hypothetical protein